MCCNAVIALSGRTPREGTGATWRRGGAFHNRCGRATAARTSLEGRGQPGGGPVVEPVWTAARRDEAEAWAEHPCHAGSFPGHRRMRVAPKPGLPPLPATARRSRRLGRQRESAEGVECRVCMTQADCGFAGARRDGGTPITT